MSPVALALDLLGVLLATLLLGLGAWVAGLATLAWVVTREALGAAVLVRAAAGLAATAVAYIALVTVLALVFPG